jgi:HEAT repeat protein
MSAGAAGPSDGHARAVTALIEALQSDSSERARTTSAWALGNAGEEEAIEALSASLGDKDARVRVAGGGSG